MMDPVSAPLTRFVRDDEACSESEVFMGSGLAAPRRPGMTANRAAAHTRNPAPFLRYPPGAMIRLGVA